jgi:hypothetical protein
MTVLVAVAPDDGLSIAIRTAISGLQADDGDKNTPNFHLQLAVKGNSYFVHLKQLALSMKIRNLYLVTTFI